MTFSRFHAGLAGWVLLGFGTALCSVAVAQGGTWTVGASSAASANPVSIGYAPDPPPITSASQWLITFEYRHGKVAMRDARRVQLKKPVATPRRIGRYAAELLSGPTVVERVRFDFPLIGADEVAGQQRPRGAPLGFEAKATVTYRIMLPDTRRASKARLVDRATGETIAIPWPPAPAASSASAASAARPKQIPDAGRDEAVDAGTLIDGGAGTDRNPDASPAPSSTAAGALQTGRKASDFSYAFPSNS